MHELVAMDEISVGEVSLDPADWGAFRVQAHRMLDDMIDYTEGIRQRPLWQRMPDKLRAEVGAPLPLEPAELEAVHGEFMREMLPYALGNVHPGFMGWVHGGGSPVGMLAAMLAAGMNANVGGRDHAPVEIERQVAEWMRQLFGFPVGATGLCVTGTSMANLIAVIVARNAAMVDRHLVCYASAAVHGSIRKALDVAGLGSDALRSVETDGRGRMSIDALERRIQRDRHDGMTPFMVVGTAGSVDTGAIDDLSAIAAVCERQKLWFHVDGAFGALAILSPELAPRLAGIERADSIAFDFHKWAQVPYDAGYILVRDGQRHRQAFASGAAYLQRESRGMAAGNAWPCDLGVDLSRGFHVLKVWFTFKVYGASAIGAVISQTCALARYLAARIQETTDLEVLAPVELNIVCFRFRAANPDEVNRQIVVDLQEQGNVAPSMTTLHGSAAIRAAIVNHRTTRAEIDTLVEQTVRFGRALTAASRGFADSVPKVHERATLHSALRGVERLLQTSPQSVDLLFQRACLLEHTGRLDEAAAGYRGLLERDAAHLGALNNLGNLLLASGQAIEARQLYEQAIAADVTHLASRANLGNLLIKCGEVAAACEQFRIALGIDPEYRAAHAGLSFGLEDIGDPEGARRHRQRAFGDRAVVIAAYRGDRPPITILELVSVTGGNIRTDTFLSDRVFQRILVTTEFYKPGTTLPPHDLVINAIGEADSAVAALDGALAVLRDTTAPVINPPAAVLATGRVEIARRLAGIPGVVTAKTMLLARDMLRADALEALGFEFPLLLRSPGFHGGEHFERVESPGHLEAALAELPGDELLVIQYLDARGADGMARKYRVMMVDGEIYPLHVAVSQKWKIHYFSADMVDSPENRAEDAAFLQDIEGVIGVKGIAALRAIQANLGLDYGGIDFGLNEQGEVLLFEANATMVVMVPDKDARWVYRREPVERIYKAVWEMLRLRARVLKAA